MLKELAFIHKSKKRAELLELLEVPRTPTQLAKHMKSSLPNVSLKLSDLVKKGFITCVNPKDRKGRIYTLTDKGKKVLKKSNEMKRFKGKK